MKKQKEVKRNLFAELMEGVREMREHREGKVSLRTYRVQVGEVKPPRKTEVMECNKENQ